MSPKVTVLMAVHNGEPYVRDALRSVLDQTFTDFELLVVDDASTDGTRKIVECLGDERVRVLRNERNVGQVPSLNRGLAEAKGIYVARLDADDACKPVRLARQVEILDTQPRVGLVGTWMEAIDERGRTLGVLEKRLDDYVDFIYHTLIMRVYVSHPSSMYRLEPVRKLGGYDEATGPAEDKDLWRKLALERYEARIVPEHLVLYRLHDRQLSQTHAAYQRRVDGASQDRFIEELAPDAPATAVRMLLAGDAEAWMHDPEELLNGTERVLAGARARLALDEDEADRLHALVVRRLHDVSTSRPWSPAARVVADYATARLPSADRAAARRRRRRALLVAPPVAGARWAAGRVAATLPGTAAIRRVPLARRLYGRAMGGG
jgi:GT2 family glycosyltransferase